VRSFVRGTAWVSAIVGAICLLLYLFLFDTWVVPQDDPMFVVSVLPTLKPGDRILIRREQVPIFGQLARCVHPENPSKFIVARLFGQPRDVVEIKNEGITVSGQRVAPRVGCPGMRVMNPVSGEEIQLTCGVEENPAWTYQALYSQGSPEGDRLATVEEGKVFLISDNRHLHQDSRDFGMVDPTKCEHIVFRLWGDSFIDGSRRFNILW
jgi:signal peptidase I